MSPEVAVRFRDVSKRYRKRSGRAGPRELLGRSPDRFHQALSDLSFDIPAGQATALLGANGAGKSTLLRLVAGISRPTAGSIDVRGQVGALMELSSGVHPELTGRENIRLYGRILGLSRRQVAERFDAIVAFSELEHVLDQQAKHYSSGMQLRLGFSIAAHVEPEVLLIDEALTVGDARFQRRCLERMRELLGRGTTVLYVSHDLRSVEAVCDRALLLEQGRLAADGPCRSILQLHVEELRERTMAASSLAAGTELGVASSDNPLALEAVELLDAAGRPVASVPAGGTAQVVLSFAGTPMASPHVAVGISPRGPEPLVVFSMAEHGSAPAAVGSHWSCRLLIDSLPLRAGSYELWLNVTADDAVSNLFEWAHVLTFMVTAEPGPGRRGVTEVGPILVDHRFEVDGELAELPT